MAPTGGGDKPPRRAHDARLPAGVGSVLRSTDGSPDSLPRATPISIGPGVAQTPSTAIPFHRRAERAGFDNDKGNDMNSVSSTTKPLAQQGQDAADKAADSAQGAIRSTQRAAEGALDNLSSKVESAREQAAPLLNRVSSQAEAAARRGIEAVRDTSQQLREKALRASDSAVGYVKDEPIKSMLIAAATGALLMGLVALMSRSRD